MDVVVPGARLPRAVKAWMAITALACLVATAARGDDGACRTTGEASLAAAKTLEQRPGDLNARLEYADALMADNCFAEAVHTLEEGEALHGEDAELQSHLREARSMVREQSYFDDLNRAEESAKVSRNLLRCNKLADVEACDQALRLKPDDPQILMAKADALRSTGRPAEALVEYGHLRQLTPDDATLEPRIAAVESERRALLDTCQRTTGPQALQACRSARMTGAEDEFAILKRTGILLQSADQPGAALDSYIAANLLKPGDRSTALAIMALSASTGRRDALTLAARGSALLTLGRAQEAVAPLKQALALAPDLPGAKAQLARAQRLAQTAARRETAVTQRKVTPALSYSNSAPATNSN
jgi:tetratricopeptide (TPR) repeat protein